MTSLTYFLAQLAVYLLILLANDYLGSLLAIILGAIAFAVWGISRIVELIQASRVPKWYYRAVFAAWVAPLAALLIYAGLRGGFDWLAL